MKCAALILLLLFSNVVQASPAQPPSPSHVLERLRQAVKAITKAEDALDEFEKIKKERESKIDEILEDELKKNPNSEDARYRYALRAYMKDNLDEALKRVDKVLEINPQNESANMMKENIPKIKAIMEEKELIKAKMSLIDESNVANAGN